MIRVGLYMELIILISMFPVTVFAGSVEMKISHGFGVHYRISDTLIK